MHSASFRQLFALSFLCVAGLLLASGLQAWQGPSQTAPGGNVAAPLNVGSTDQVKNAGLSVNSFTNYGGSYFAGNVGIGQSSPAQKLVVNGNSWLNGDLIVQSGKTGLGIATPATALEVVGSVKFGNGGEACGASTEGAQRYNGTSRKMEYCDSSAWQSFGSEQAAQTWQDMLSQRAANTEYTNTTGRPIEVSISTTGSSVCSATLRVNGVSVASQYTNGTGGERCSVIVTVPAGATYELAKSGTLSIWQELR